MSITKEEIPKFTNFSNKTITANEDFRPIIFEQLGLVKTNNDSFISFIEEQVIFGEKKKNLLVERDNSLISSNKLIKKIYNRLDEDFPNKISFFMGKTRASHISKSIDKTIIFIKELLPKMESEGHGELENFKDNLISTEAEQRLISNKLYTLDADISLSKAESDKESDKWELNYSILKDFVKGECKRLKIDYKMFFYDLKYKKKAKPSIDKPSTTENKEENVVKEDVNPISDKENKEE